MSDRPASPLSDELVVFVLAAVAFVLMAAPGITWMDDGELAAAAYALGGAHPPGHPVHTLLGKLATLIPVGEIGFRVTLVSALSMAATASGVVALARTLVPGERVASLVAGGLVVLSPVAQVNASRVEVYGPVAAMVVWATACALRFCRAAEDEGRAADALVAAVLFGCAAAVHPVIAAAAAVVPALAVIRAAGVRLIRIGPWALLLGLLPLIAYAQLAVRAGAASPPLMVWGDPTSAGALWTLVTGANYQGNFALAGLAGRFSGLALLVGEGMGLGILVGGLVGLGTGAATGLRGAGTVLLSAACVIGGAALQARFNPDMPGYVLPALALLAAGLAPAIGAGLRMLPSVPTGPRRHLVAAALALPLVAVGLAGRTARATDSGFRRGDDPTRRVAATVGQMPPGPAAYVVHGDDALFPALYERIVAGYRPDVAIVNGELMRDRWFVTQVDRSLPALYVPFVNDGRRYPSMVEALVTGNLMAGRPVGGDEWIWRTGKPSPAAPMGRGYRYGPEPTRAAPAPPPPDYRGAVGARVAGRIGLTRALYEAARGRLPAAVTATALSNRFAGDEDALAAATPDPGRPVLYGLVPHKTPIFIFARWQAELFGDDLAWIAGLPPPDPAVAGAVYERRVHLVWRQVLSGAIAVDALPDGVLDADAYRVLGDLLAKRNPAASRAAYRRAGE